MPTIQDAIATAKELMAAPSCCAPLKEKTQAWLDAIGTSNEHDAAVAFVKETEEDILPIDSLIAFAESEAGIKKFGAETAKNLAAHAREVKDNGGKYCDCPACTKAKAILDMKEVILNNAK